MEIEQEAFSQGRSQSGVIPSGYKFVADIIIGAAGALALMSAVKPVRGSSH